MFSKNNLIILLLVIVSVSITCGGEAPENLDEIFARCERMTNATWPHNQLENASNHYIWQPETLSYTDNQTGHEVWRMSSSMDGVSASSTYFTDIGLNAWSADGKYLRIQSTGRPTNAYNNYRDNIYQGQMVSRSDGAALRFIINGPSRLSRNGNSEFWSPQIPDTYYQFGNGWMDAIGTPGVLYRVSLDDVDESMSPIINLSDSSYYWNYGKFMSADGRKTIVYVGEDHVFPATIYPDSAASLDDPNGYVTDRNFALYGGMNGGNLTSFHDEYFGGDGSWFFIMPNDPGSTANWWRVKTIGTSEDGGAFCNNSDFPVTYEDLPYDFGECWPENHGSISDGNSPSPFVQLNPYSSEKTCYWSHFVPDRWGRHALFSCACDNLPVWRGNYSNTIGPGVWDMQNHSWIVPSFGGGAQHHDWKGFTDWVVSSGGTGGYPDQVIYAGNINDENSQITVNAAYTRYYGGEDYSSLVRPSQSPDGTKVAWHSEFLNGPDNVDIFWSVVMYPSPPTSLEANYNSGVEIGFLPPKYTGRGWPYANATKNAQRDGAWPELKGEGLEIGEPLYAREISRYHIWRANDQNGPWQEVGTEDYLQDYEYHPSEDPNDELMMLHPVDSQGYRISDTNKLSFIDDNVGDGTWYYALTSEEHSGLESHELSEILEVVVSGTSVVDVVVQPEGETGFWTKLPETPLDFRYQATGTPGQYQLRWPEPDDESIRFYNLYYSNQSNPPANQQHRFASVPAGTTSYLDWLADPEEPGYYGITSVDRQDNEGLILYFPATETPPTRFNPAPSGTLPSGTTSANISLSTNVQAICRYSNVSGTNYSDIPSNFTYTNLTNHFTLVSGLENGQNYTFYVRCNSSDGYVNDDDFNITFSTGGHKADLNDDGLINMPELMLFIARWKANDGVSKAEVLDARDIWFGGGVY